MIKNHNANIIFPDKNSLMFEKNVVLEWLSYNTPTFHDISITPLLGTGYLDYLCEDNDTFSKSTYLNWYVSLLYLGWEYDKLIKAKSNLDNSILHNNLEDPEDEYVIYWLNRQLRLNPKDLFINNQHFICDFFDEYIFYRELNEDLMYVLLNLLLGIKIINSFDPYFVNNGDEFVIKLTEIIKEHYILYCREYEYLNELRWYKINYMMCTHHILEIYKVEISNRAQNQYMKK